MKSLRKGDILKIEGILAEVIFDKIENDRVYLSTKSCECFYIDIEDFSILEHLRKVEERESCEEIMFTEKSAYDILKMPGEATMTVAIKAVQKLIKTIKSKEEQIKILKNNSKGLTEAYLIKAAEDFKKISNTLKLRIQAMQKTIDEKDEIIAINLKKHVDDRKQLLKEIEAIKNELELSKTTRIRVGGNFIVNDIIL